MVKGLSYFEGFKTEFAHVSHVFKDLHVYSCYKVELNVQIPSRRPRLSSQGLCCLLCVLTECRSIWLFYGYDVKLCFLTALFVVLMFGAH